MTDPKIIDIGEPPNPETLTKKKISFVPLTNYGVPRWLVLVLGLIGLIYILNPTMGLFELIPDTLPVIGHLDESAAFLMAFYGIIELIKGKQQARD
jgi:uncharacterized membrane protein YkvA (DUF1232 family)